MTIKEFEIQYALGLLTADMKIELVQNAKTSKKILTKLSNDKDCYIRYYVAANPNTPIEILTKLRKDKDWEVRCSATYNFNILIAPSKKLNVKMRIARGSGGKKNKRRKTK
jgi:3-methyladenine DNA glycosylase AlkC